MKRPGRIGIDCLSVFGLPPVQFIELAADLRCEFITLGIPVTFNPEHYPSYSLNDVLLQRDIKGALQDNGVAVKAGEGFLFTPGKQAQHFAPHLDAMAAIGAETINMVGMNGDLSRLLDEIAALAEMAAARGMSSSLEFVAGQTIGCLEDGAKAVRHVGRSDFKLVIDMLHLARSGAAAADLAAFDADMIGYIQLCDCRYEATDRLSELMHERMSPGAGEIPLLDLLAALPRDIPVGVEVPQRSLAEAGFGPMARLAPCVAEARALLRKRDAFGARAA